MYTSSPSRNTMARNPSHFGSKSHPSPSGRTLASLASIGSTGGAMGKAMRRSGRTAAARRDPSLRRGPARVERASGLIDVDDQRRMVGGDGLALAGFAVDLRPHHAAGEGD